MTNKPGQGAQQSIDLALTNWGDSGQLKPLSVLGTLWLQQRFDPTTWDLVCTGGVRLRTQVCHELTTEAAAAGLAVEHLSPPAAG